VTDFLWRDGNRKIRFGRGAIGDAGELIHDGFVLLTTERARELVPGLADRADEVVIVRPGLVDEISEELLPTVKAGRLVALGGGRVVDTAKAIGSVTGATVGAIPTTLSGAEMARSHRFPKSAPQGTVPIRPNLVINDPSLTASQPLTDLAASAANALAHAIEGRVTVRSSPVPAMAAEEAMRLIDIAFYTGEPSGGDREKLALGALLAGYTTDSTGIALHHVMAQTLVRIGGADHAASNAVLLPHTIVALERRNPGYVDADGTLAELAKKLGAIAGTERIRDLGVDESALPKCAKAAASRDIQLALTPPPADEAELLSIYQAAW
jgi:alcohol dehydrogenase class IV